LATGAVLGSISESSSTTKWLIASISFCQSHKWKDDDYDDYDDGDDDSNCNWHFPGELDSPNISILDCAG